MDVAPMADRAENVPCCSGNECAVLATTRRDFRQLDFLDADSCAALIGEFEASPCFEIDLFEEIAFDTATENVVDLLFFSIDEGARDVM